MRLPSIALLVVTSTLGTGFGCGSSSHAGGPDGGGDAGQDAATITTVTNVGTGRCTFSASYSLSGKIDTVGIVTFSTTASSPTEAHIDFGLDTSYGMTAPVDLRRRATGRCCWG